MGYVKPPLIATLGWNVTNVLTNTTLIAAPGATFRLRIVGLHFAMRVSTAGVLTIQPTNGVGGSAIATVTLNPAGTSYAPVDIPEPGLILDENTLLNLAHVATAAGPFATLATAYYYIDAIS